MKQATGVVAHIKNDPPNAGIDKAVHRLVQLIRRPLVEGGQAHSSRYWSSRTLAFTLLISNNGPHHYKLPGNGTTLHAESISAQAYREPHASA